MRSQIEKRFALLIYLGKVIELWAGNVEPYHQEFTREERSQAFTAIKSCTGTYIDVRTCTDEDIANLYYEVIMKLLDGRVKVRIAE